MGSPGTISVNRSVDVNGWPIKVPKWQRQIAENFNGLSRAHQRYRQTDGTAIAYSEREREFTFAKQKLLLATATDRLTALVKVNGLLLGKIVFYYDQSLKVLYILCC